MQTPTQPIDSLTGLPQLPLFKRQLEQGIQKLKQGQCLCLLTIEISNFKAINLYHGYERGDWLLIALVDRLRNHFSNLIDIGRTGGNELCLMIRCGHAATQHLYHDLDIFKSQGFVTFNILAHRIKARLTTGVVIADNTSYRSAEKLLVAGQLAVKQAYLKRSTYQVFCPDFGRAERRKIQLLESLDAAISQPQLQLFYQPQIHLHNYYLSGCEALLRWHHPELGTIQPKELFELAASVGREAEITGWVLQQVLQQILLWQRNGIDHCPVAINITAADLATKHLRMKLAGYAEQYPGILASLQLEITESFLLNDVSFAIQELEHLHQMGIIIAIDDFGTGYSSLNYLAQLPIDKLKIDRSFVMALFDNDKNKVIVDAILDLAKHLSLTVCAEGIETEAQLIYLKNRGVQTGQGFFFAQALTATDFSLAYLSSRHWATGC